ncbi:MAG: hypothetical protein J3Q66DRAFT_429141 [Benniella sp.]|nr:MAG: hypothetical protein J3Q66DRAFT_429141 [Benniella sp.]
MALPIGFLISAQELAMFAHGSSESSSFLANLSLIYPDIALGANAGDQIGNGCLVHFVVLRQPAPARHRRGYAQIGGFDANVFEQIVAPTIQDPQQRADCRARLQQGDYLIIKPAPREEWDNLSNESPASSVSGGSPPKHSTLLAMNQMMGSQIQVVQGEGGYMTSYHTGPQEPPTKVRNMRAEKVSFRPQRVIGEVQFETSVIAFANTGAALLPQTDRQGTDTYWGAIIEAIMEHPIFLEFVRQRLEGF